MNNSTIRWCLVLIGLIFNITNYTISPFRVSKKKNPLINISYNKIFFIIFLILFIIDILFIIYLNSIKKPLNNLPNLWWILLILIFGTYLLNLYINTEYINITCNRKPIDKCEYDKYCIVDTILNSCEDKFIKKPVIFFKKSIRTILNIIIILIFGISYIYEYYLTNPDMIPNNSNIIKYMGWLRIISIVFIIYITIVNKNYIPCKYGLPSNW